VPVAGIAAGTSMALPVSGSTGTSSTSSTTSTQAVTPGTGVGAQVTVTVHPDAHGKYWYFGEAQSSVPNGFGTIASPSGLYEGDVRLRVFILLPQSASV
jgi:hypothetical protein